MKFSIQYAIAVTNAFILNILGNKGCRFRQILRIVTSFFKLLGVILLTCQTKFSQRINQTRFDISKSQQNQDSSTNLSLSLFFSCKKRKFKKSPGWSSGDTFVSGAVGLRFNSWAD